MKVLFPKKRTNYRCQCLSFGANVNKNLKGDIHLLLSVSFVGDYGKYTACMLHDDEDVMNMFFMFVDISKLTCLELYITTTDQPIQTCAYSPPISKSSFNFEDLDEYLTQAMNLESSFEEPYPPQFI